MTRHSCRFCSAALRRCFVDLGTSPLANSYLTEEQLDEMEPFYPLRVLVCEECFLVQLPALETPERLFGEYAYFSSYSTTWLAHAEAYAEQAVERFGLGADSLVVEIASNDGYLLQFFAARGVPVLGVEPARNVAEAAERKGIPTLVEFFGRELGARLRDERPADLVVANNVLAHVPDLNDFVAGLAELLAPEGVLTIEVPHLLHLIEQVQFDTVYHEHFSYFSLLTLKRVLAAHDLEVFDVEEIATHGGSLRVYAGHRGGAHARADGRVAAVEAREREAALARIAPYAAFAERVYAVKREVLAFFVERKREGRTIAGYGAPAKGNTFLNFCGLGRDFVDFTVDLNPAKQGRFLPGTHIPIRAPDEVRRRRPDYLFILAWNLRSEVMEQMSFVREWGGRFVTASPAVRVDE